MAFGVCTNCLSSFPPSTGQKWKIFAKHFFDIVTIYNDEICYVKHVLAPFMCFSHYLGVGRGGGGAPKGARAQPAYAVFLPQQLKNGCPSPLFEVPSRRQ